MAIRQKKFCGKQFLHFSYEDLYADPFNNIDDNNGQGYSFDIMKY